jgi:hypothetical protein
MSLCSSAMLVYWLARAAGMPWMSAQHFDAILDQDAIRAKQMWALFSLDF